MSRVLIAGCGDVGSSLGLRLAAAGHEVWGLRRNPAAIPQGIHRVCADMTEPATLVNLPPDIDSVVYLATADRYDDTAYRRAYVEAPRNLLAALARAHGPLGRFVFVSSTSVYAHNAGEWVDENSPTEPEQFSGKRLLEGERLARSGPASAVIVRFAGIYGPGRGRLQRRVIEGKPCRQTPPLYTNRIHRDDCAAVLDHVVSLAAPDPIYIGVDCEPAPQCAVMDWLAARLGVPAPPRVDCRGAHDARIRSNKRCSNARLLASGYRFIYPSYREGYAKILDDAGADAGVDAGARRPD